MSEVLSRIFPAVRNARTPLIVGSAWFAVLGFVQALIDRDSINATDTSDDPVVKLLHDTLSPLPEWVVVATIVLAATLLGSGVVRLMDRTRQAFRYPEPLVDVAGNDIPDKYKTFVRELVNSEPPKTDQRLRRIGQRIQATRDSPLDSDRSNLVAIYILNKLDGDPARREWGGPGDAPSVFRDDLRLFLFHLARDERFDGYNDQQLLRFSLIPPLCSTAVITIIWASIEWSASKLALIVVLVACVAVLYIDRFRLRSLLVERWEELADEYPNWLPDAALDRRNLGRERVREILHGPSGIRSVAALDGLLRSKGEPDTETTEQRVDRRRVLSATSKQVRLSGAPELADALDRLTSGDETNAEDFDEFYRRAARWSGSRIEYCSKSSATT